MTNMWKRVGAVLLSSAILVAGCSGGGSSTGNNGSTGGTSGSSSGGNAQLEPKKGGTLTVALAAGPRNIDPRMQWDSNSHIVHNNLAERLFAVGGDNQLKMLLAEDWSSSEDGKVYTINLRKGVTFHDGMPVSAEAIKQNILWAAKEEHKSPQVTMWDQLDRVETPDEHTVMIHLKNPMAMPTMTRNLLDSPWPISAAQIAANGGNAITAPLGAGPFKFVSYTGDDKVVLERNDSYWAGPAYLDQVIYRVIPDPSTRRVEMEAKTVDILMDVSPKDVESYKKLGMQVITGPAPTNAMLSMNLASPPLQDLAVRQAIAHAIDRDAVIEKLFDGYADKATTYLHPENVNHDKSIPAFDYSLDKAKRILDDAGYKVGADGIRSKDGKRLELTIGSRNNDVWSLMSQVLAEQLRAIGIASTINTTDTTAFYDSVRAGTYDIAYWVLNSSSWESLDHPNLRSTDWGNIAHLAKSTPQIQAIQVELDRMIAGFEQSLDAADRKKYADQLQKTIQENVITVPLWFEQRIYVMQPYVMGVEAPTVTRNVFLHQAWLNK